MTKLYWKIINNAIQNDNSCLEKYLRELTIGCIQRNYTPPRCPRRPPWPACSHCSLHPRWLGTWLSYRGAQYPGTSAHCNKNHWLIRKTKTFRYFVVQEWGFGFFYTLKVIYRGTVFFSNIFKSYKLSVESVKLGILLPKRFRLGNIKFLCRTIVWMTLFSFHCKDCRSWFGMLPKKKQTKNSQITSQVNPNIDKIEDAFNQKCYLGVRFIST